MWVGSTTDAFSEKRFKDRVRFFSLVFVIFSSVVVLRLFFLQVVKGDRFAQVSESNRTKTIFLGAPRGIFWDSKGDILVRNRPSWSLLYSVTPQTPVTQEKVLARLRPFLESFPNRWEKRLEKAFTSKQLVRLAEDVPAPIAFGLREMGDLLPGFRMEMEFRRQYPNGVQAAQLMGYLAEIDEKELDDSYWFSRKPGDLIGKMGLEKLLDAELRGQDGGMLIEVDSVGRLKRVIRELGYLKGSSVQLTLDSALQKVAQDSLAKTKTQRGAAVAIDVKTGAIRAWVSAPTVDPTGSLADDVLDTANKPFFDRVFRGAYPPGSLFKIMTAISGFENNKINVKETIVCKGYEILRDRRRRDKRYGCWRRHGKVDYWKAMQDSCDSYFYLLGQKLGADLIHDTAKQFGLGGPVQNLLPGENKGNIPNRAWKRKRGLGGWSTGDTFNMSIGQGYVTSTPLQMAVMMSGVASRGHVMKPYLVEKVVDRKGQPSFQASPELWKSIELEETIWSNILYSLGLVVRKGTGRASFIKHLDVRGKTGTAQNPHGDDHAWFLAMAGYPEEEPSLVVCVFVENGGHGGSAAAPIARRMLETALPKREERTVS